MPHDDTLLVSSKKQKKINFFNNGEPLARFPMLLLYIFVFSLLLLIIPSSSLKVIKVPSDDRVNLLSVGKGWRTPRYNDSFRFVFPIVSYLCPFCNFWVAQIILILLGDIVSAGQVMSRTCLRCFASLTLLVLQISCNQAGIRSFISTLSVLLC